MQSPPIIPSQATTHATNRFIFPCAMKNPASSSGISSGIGSPSPQAKSSPNRMKYPPHSNQASTVSGLKKTAIKSMSMSQSVILHRHLRGKFRSGEGVGGHLSRVIGHSQGPSLPKPVATDQ